MATPILERHVHTVSNAAYWEREAAFKAVEDRLGGFPQKIYYSLLSVAERTGTIVHKREWESFAVMEAAQERLWAEPGIEDLAASGPGAAPRSAWNSTPPKRPAEHQYRAAAQVP